jgi:phospholipid/cholesterol/gamma-HCH transport system permease protein
MSTATSPFKPAPAREEQPEPAGGPGALRSGLREMGDLAAFMGTSLKGLPKSTLYLSEGLRQAAILIKGTSLLLLVMNMFLGITVTSFAFFVLRPLGATDFVGFFSGYISPRHTGPQMFGLVFAAKVCSGMAAEIGAMKVQQEIDALRVEGIDPTHYIVGTRLIGVIIFVPIATAITLIGQFLGDYLNTVLVLQAVPAELLERLQWYSQSGFDQVVALSTIMFMAIPCTLVGCFYGLRTQGGPVAVGESVARSLLINIPLVNILPGTMALLVYGNNLHIPIGG